MTQTVKPEDMSQVVWGSLMGYLARQRDRGYRSTIERIWYSYHPPPTANNVSGYWRAKLKLNEVAVRIYYSPTKGRWTRQ